MKNDLTTGAWQHDIGCPISITLLSTSDERHLQLEVDARQEVAAGREAMAQQEAEARTRERQNKKLSCILE